MAFTGLTANTKKNIQLDAGCLYKNYTVGGTSNTLIGATEGGATLAMVPEVRQISVDGAKGPTKGFEVIDGWTCTLTANIKEVKKDTILLALGAADVSSESGIPTGYDKLELRNEVKDADYLTNITWVGKIAGSDKPIIIILKNALCLNGFNFTVADKAEGNIPLVMTAHYDVTDLDEVPVEIYTPTIS